MISLDLAALLRVLDYVSRRQRISARLDTLIETPWDDVQAKRLIKRLRRHRNDFFTLKKRGHNPVNTIHDALTAHLKTGKLPPLPKTAAASR